LDVKKVLSLLLVSLMIFIFVGCEGAKAVDSQTAQNNDLSDEKLAEIVAEKLDVPKNENITYKVGEKTFWEAGDTYYKYVSFYENGEVVASASVNPQNGELLKNILKYSAFESLSDSLIREIDGAYHEESKLPENSSTGGMVEVAAKYTDKWKEIADEYYDKIMDYGNSEQTDESVVMIDELKASVSKMKTNWERYYKEQSEAYANTLYAVYNGGTIIHPMIADYKYDQQKEWTLRLVSIYEQI
jgi:hypothetical protein